MLLWYNAHYYIHMSITKFERLDIVQNAHYREKINPIYDLRALQARNECPQLEAPFKALMQIRKKNPLFLEGMDCPALAYTLFTINPNETEKIARFFKTDRETLGGWFSDLIETVTDNEWSLFEEVIESLEASNRKPHYVSSQLWLPDPSVDTLLEPLGPGLKKLVQAALTSSSYEEIQKKSGQTYKGSRQRLTDARKILEPHLAPQGYVRLGRTDSEILSISMGLIPYLKIGTIIYVKETDRNRIVNTIPPQPSPILETVPAFKRERVNRPRPFKPREKRM